jgi:serine/threonine protein kinase
VEDPVARRSGLLSGRYALEDVIGRGGMGVVHRAWDTHLQRRVAVKILRDRATDAGSRARFRTEGETLGRLGHPGLITVLDAATEDDEPYLVMELVDGESLTERCRDRRLDVGEVTRLGAELAEALDHVHQHRIVHRDIKPSNVLIGWDGRVKLADFGVARLLDGITRHTASGVTVGTAAYLSPEQVRGQPITVASDIYSLGLVLIEMLSGEPAFTGSWDVVALVRLTTSPRIDPALPAALRELLAAMTLTDPGRRPTARQVAAALRSRSAGPIRVPAQPKSPERSADVPTVPPARKPGLPPVPAPRLPTSGRVARRTLIAVAVLIPAVLLGFQVGGRPDSGGGSAGKGSVSAALPEPSPTAATAPAERTVKAPASSNLRSKERPVVVQKPSARPPRATSPTPAATATAATSDKAKARAARLARRAARAEARAARLAKRAARIRDRATP